MVLYFECFVEVFPPYWPALGDHHIWFVLCSIPLKQHRQYQVHQFSQDCQQFFSEILQIFLRMTADSFASFWSASVIDVSSASFSLLVWKSHMCKHRRNPQCRAQLC